ncbi:MAG: YdbL family protein [Deltaproteobacteria bacterium]|nr:YdbL family protein [Deltaproteobacteria bacterium]
MKGIRKPFWIASLLFLFTLACVTINIYFPAEKVETVAEDIVDDIRGRESAQEQPGQSQEKDSFLHRIRTCAAPRTAWAQDVTEVSNATIRGLKERMKARYQQMKTYYDKGLIKEGNDGYVSTGDLGGLDLRAKRDVKSLVDAENQDRKALYKEVAKALKIDPSQIDRIGGIFAKEWQK